MIVVYKYKADEMVYRKHLNEDLIWNIVEFINQRELILKGDFYECWLRKKELGHLIELLQEEIHYFVLREKSYDYFELARNSEERMNNVELLLTIFEEIQNEEIEYVVLYIDQDHLAVEDVIDEKLSNAVESYLEIVKYTEYGMYSHQIDLDESIAPDFFNSLDVNWSVGIGQIWSKDETFTEKMIPLKGYQVIITTDVKQYFTKIYEVTYTAYHIYRNARDHRYSYKEKRAQRIYRFLVDAGGSDIEVNRRNEQVFFNRLNEAQQLQEHFNKKAEEGLEELYKLNKAITSPFLTNKDYYQNVYQIISDYVHRKYYARIIQTFLLLGYITIEEYSYHLNVIESIKREINDIDYLIDRGLDEVEILTRQAALIRYFVASTEIAPKAGILEIEKGTVQRTLMQIEQERGYSDEFRSDDSLKEYYKYILLQKKF
ncbi:hypothetical protein [Lysinibacillus sp. OTC-L20]|uniref:hypothetical protein n=1 Tax=Lysinibacillus sp. OTC-L20 TaxID=3342791 RepID=UPI0035BA7032